MLLQRLPYLSITELPCSHCFSGAGEGGHHAASLKPAAQPPASSSTDQGPFLSRVAAPNTVRWLLLPLAGGTQSCVPSREHILAWRKVPLPHACCWHSAGSCEEARDLKRRSYSYRNRLKPSIFLKLKKKKSRKSSILTSAPGSPGRPGDPALPASPSGPFRI